LGEKIGGARNNKENLRKRDMNNFSFRIVKKASEGQGKLG